MPQRVNADLMARLKAVLRNMILNQARLCNVSPVDMMDLMAELLDELRQTAGGG